jgi:hypothetical protein
MMDDGLNGDGGASDGKYGVAVPVNSLQIQYYIYADNNNAGMFSPQRAEHEYHVLNALGSPTVGQVFINEFLADNAGDVSNETFQYEDWIELYNASAITIELGGSFLTDNFSSPTKFQIPNGTVIPPYGYLIFWADEDPSTASYVHCNFKLSAGGEQLMLSSASGTVLDSITFGPQTTDKSMARCPDGVGTFTMATFPTFKLSNCAIGVNELNADKSEIRIFPNPAHNYFVIRSSGKGQEGLVVYNTLGEEIYKTHFTKEINVNTSGWEPGIYFVRTQNSTKKLIVTH